MLNKQFLSIPLKAIVAIVILLFTVVPDTAEAQLIPRFGDSRSGTSGFQFLKINPDARSVGLGSSNTADAMDGSSLYLNPALAAQMGNSQVYLAHTQYFVDTSLNFASYVHRYRGLAIGGSLMYFNSGDIDETTEFNPFGTGRTFRTVHLAAGLTFAQELTNLFSYGVTLKYLDERIEEIQYQSIVFDLGFFYRVGDTGMRFAVGLSNFGLDASPSGETTRPTLDGPVTESDFEDVSPPTTFTLGAAYDAWSNDQFAVTVMGQVTNPSDNAEQLSIGTELGYIGRFFFRTGYEIGVDEAVYPNFGIGINLPVSNYHLGIDYGFSSRQYLGTMHRFALKFNL